VVISDPRHSKVSALRPKAQIPGPQSTRSATFSEQLAKWRGSVGSPAARTSVGAKVLANDTENRIRGRIIQIDALVDPERLAVIAPAQPNT
jgi:hypothetical protein